jgi:hypothetical protein
MPRITKKNPLTNYISKAEINRIRESIYRSIQRNKQKIGTRCECGAPYLPALGVYACAKLGTDSLV